VKTPSGLPFLERTLKNEINNSKRKGGNSPKRLPSPKKGNPKSKGKALLNPFGV